MGTAPGVQLYEEPPGGFKKRRTPGACDMCKQRKKSFDLPQCVQLKLVRTGDSAKMPGNICSNCKAFNSECTHSSLYKKKTAFVNNTASQGLASQNQAIPINILDSDDDFNFAQRQISTILDAPNYQVPVNDNTLLHRTLTEIAAYARSLEKTLLGTSSHRTTPEPLSNTSSHPSPSSNPHVSSTSLHPTDPTAVYSAYEGHGMSDDDEPTNLDPAPIEVNLADSIKNLELTESAHTFFGKSSQLALMKTVRKIKEEYDGDTIGSTTSLKRASEKSKEASVEHGSNSDGNRVMQIADAQESHFKGKKRAAFWNVYSWQRPLPQPPRPEPIFPPHSLLVSLVDLFFVHRNPFLPLLHRPTFQRELDSHLHERDRGFGELVLSVCALGARFSSDERVFDDAAPLGSDERGHSAGWKYINQIDSMQAAHPKNALYKVQTICNIIVFLSSTSSPGPIWSLLSLGVRHAQAVGAHRRNFLGTKPSVRQELWKRAYWALINLDSFTSVFLGRPKATDPAEYDLDLPIECDDEFWEHPDPKQAFKQPPGRPSLMTFWTTFLKLIEILAFAQKNIYAVKKPAEVWGSSDLWGPSWDTRVVSELDSALNQWVDDIPAHLRWDPHREDLIFFEQSSALYCTYYFVQIHVHRPFIRPEIPLASREQRQQHYSGMSYSSLGVCANAARSCLHVLDLHSRRTDFRLPRSSPSSSSSSPSTLYALSPTQMTNSSVILFNSTIMILLNLWSGKRLGLATDVRREMEDVYLSVRILKGYEKKYQNAGRMCDIINELISVMAPSDPDSSPHSRKHDRDEDRENTSNHVRKFRTHTNNTTDTHTEGPRSHYDSSVASLFNSQSSLTNTQNSQIQYPSPNSRSIFSSPMTGLPSSSSSSSYYSQHNSLSYPDVHSFPLATPAEFLDEDMTSDGMLDLPLHTEDLGRLPIHLGSNYGNQLSNHPEVNDSVGPTLDSTLGPNEFGVDPVHGLQYASLNTGTGNTILRSDAFSEVPPENWGLVGSSEINQNHVGYRGPAGLHTGFVDGIEQVQPYQDDNLKFPWVLNEYPFTNMFNPTPARDGWFDWETYLSNVDHLLRSIDSGQR
ncbi:fungal-specific transcription factor domain-containing protein [Lentinula aciculospora]|uniref:Fungal-specific transcription factor domain-containing protein n=1 Tax=Lentinula aciculospora TaxID=153920 RepID=A0A9W9A6Y5_9AGAR|nr:fungal-specific transcription factor domain-containing protein [Lentinula aciculospora]